MELEKRARFLEGATLRNHGGPSRRDLLHGAACLLAGSFVPCARGMRAQTENSVMSMLSTYMSEAATRALPEEVVEKVKQHILDTLAAMISGRDLPPGRSALRFARVDGGEKVATVAASKILCGPIEAALANGMLAHADETDDSHAPSQSHPGCAVVPAALAVGEKFRISGTGLLRAVALGYDVGTRVTMTLGAVDFQARSHRDSHSYAGVFGAAAAAGCAAGLNTEQMRWLLDYAAQQASGLAAWQRDKDHIEKAFVFAGMPARNGVTAALLVHSGWTGVDDIFSGANNFLLANAVEASPLNMIDGLGERYEVTRTNIKKWAVGSPVQGPLDAVELLTKKHRFTAERVKSVRVRVAAEEAVVVDNRDMPDICLQHLLALMLVDRDVSFRSAHDKTRMQDPEILRQRAKVQLIPDIELERRLPRREARVEITLADGEYFSEYVAAVRGTAENPMSREEIVAKCSGLMKPVLGGEKADHLVEQVFRLEESKDIRSLRRFLQAG